MRREVTKAHVLVVEDSPLIRESMSPLLEGAGYEISFAQDGREALNWLHKENLPDIILLDLWMPVMDGWEFRTIQKDDPRLGLVPVVAISADSSAQAAAISAQAYLCKPVNGKELLDTIERVLSDQKRRQSAQVNETERLTSLGRMAAGVGHEINNPLTFLMLNLNQSIEELRPLALVPEALAETPSPKVELQEMKDRMASVTTMLEDCQIGGERIRETVSNLQRLSRQEPDKRSVVDVAKLIEQSSSMAWNQIRHRARLIKTLEKVPLICGNGAALGQVFLNLLVNAAQAIPEGHAEGNEIRVATKVAIDDHGAEIVVEISDTGSGIEPEIMSHLFEPFFTTKAIGQGTGLGLSISRQTISDHGGRITVENQPDRGTVFRVFLPLDASDGLLLPALAAAGPAALAQGRILVVDDEPLIGRIIRAALKGQHNVFVVHRASEALTLLEQGETFDLMLCDVVMPDLSGPELYARIAERWPQLVEGLVFMTGGAFTPETLDFMEHATTRVLSKPFSLDSLTQLVNERIRGDA